MNLLITGGTGSFGHAFTRHLLTGGPGRICILSRDEFKQHEMRETFRDERLRFFLGDVRDVDRLATAFQGIDTVVHAAALKQVPAGEYDPEEFIKTNVLGSANVLAAAREAKVGKVLLLSTDKACAPVTLYGASKLMAERLFTAANSVRGPVSACTRYGNVIDSRGSVIPVWRAAVAAGRAPVVTDPAATRFHMRQAEAVQLVMTALREMRGGEVFIPKLRSYRVGDLVRVVTGQAGEVVGLRPAEKLHELLVSRDEARMARHYGDHVRLLPEIHPWTADFPGLGTPFKDGAEYGSDVHVMTVAELRDALGEAVAA